MTRHVTVTVPKIHGVFPPKEAFFFRRWQPGVLRFSCRQGGRLLLRAEKGLTVRTERFPDAGKLGSDPHPPARTCASVAQPGCREPRRLSN